MAEHKIHISIQEDDTEFFDACKWFEVVKLTKKQKNELYRKAIVEYLTSKDGMEHIHNLALQKKNSTSRKVSEKPAEEKPIEEKSEKPAEEKPIEEKSNLRPLSSKSTKKNSSTTEQAEVKTNPYIGFDSSLAQNEEFRSLFDAMK